MAQKGRTSRTPRDGKVRKKNATVRLKRALLREWTGTWATHPKTDSERKAAALARSATSFTDGGSLMSRVAVAAIDVLGMKRLLETFPLREIAKRVAEPFYGLDGPLYRVADAPQTP